MSSKERRYFTDQYTALTPYAAPGPEYKTMASGGPVEAMSNANAIGANTGYPQADIRTGAYATPYQQPMAQNVVTGAQDAAVDPYTGQATFAGGGSINLQGTLDMDGGQGGQGGLSSLFGNSQVGGQSSGQSGGTSANGYTPMGGGFSSGYNDSQKQFAGSNNAPSAPAALPATATPQPMGNFNMIAPAGGDQSRQMQPQPGDANYDQYLAHQKQNQIDSAAEQATRLAGMTPIQRQQETMHDSWLQSAKQANRKMSLGQQPDPNDNAITRTQYENMPQPAVIGYQKPSYEQYLADIRSRPAESQQPAQPLGGLGGLGGQLRMNTGGVTGYAQGGISNLGGYSDGGRLLRGPGDGVSDSIPAMIGQKQQARLADGEFVVPARIVSELGNGSTEAGARKLYAMMDRVQKSRGKTVGKGKVATNSRASKHLPA
jgi:hypothetical protein